MRKLLLTTTCLISSMSPAFAWKTLTPTLQTGIIISDPYITWTQSITLTDMGPNGTGPEVGSQTFPVGAAATKYPPYLGSPVKFGPIPESGNCLRTVAVQVAFQVGARVYTMEVYSPKLYNACTNTGIVMQGTITPIYNTYAVSWTYN